VAHTAARGTVFYMSYAGWFVLVGIIFITALGDYSLKRGSMKINVYLNAQTHLAAILYAVTAYLWCYIFRSTTLAEVGVLYGSMTVITLVILSVFIFSEELTVRTLFGIVLALGAIVVIGTK
jgi:drug/metabolite transporter (DMT)-like permease